MIKTGNVELQSVTYPNGEHGIKNWDEFTKTLLGVGNQTIYWTSEKDYNQDLIWFLVIKNWMKQNEIKGIKLIIDYLPYEREDKTENGRVSMEPAMKEILGDFDVYVMTKHPEWDWLHLMNPTGEEAKKFWTKLLTDTPDGWETIIVFPDHSAYRRNKDILKEYNIKNKFIVLDKARDKTDGHIIGQVINKDLSTYKFPTMPDDYNQQDEGHPQRMLIVDDICSYGGTFVGAKNLISKMMSDLAIDTEWTLWTYADEGHKDKKWTDKHIFIKTIDFK